MGALPPTLALFKFSKKKNMGDTVLPAPYAFRTSGWKAEIDALEAVQCQPRWCRKAVGFGEHGNPKFGHDRKPTSGRECRFFSPFSASNGDTGHTRLVATLLRRTMWQAAWAASSCTRHEVDVLLRVNLVRIKKGIPVAVTGAHLRPEKPVLITTESGGDQC